MEPDNFVPRIKLWETIKDLEARLYTVSTMLNDAVEGLEVYADMQPTPEGIDEPNHALQVLSELKAKAQLLPFSIAPKTPW